MTDQEDAGLEQLAALSHLTRLSVAHTKVTDSGRAKLQQVLPKLAFRSPGPGWRDESEPSQELKSG
jgi:hypothetical protein